MVHEKYTYKNGKRFGPYLYENKRVNGKVVTRYLGAKENGFSNSYGKSESKKLSIVRIISFVFIIIILGMFLSLPFLFKETFNIYRLLAENFGIRQDAIDESGVFFAPGDPTISFTDSFPSTPPDLSILSLNYFDIGLLTDDSGDNHYSFVDFDRSLVGWWRLNVNDNLPQGQVDDSSYGNAGTVGGVASLPAFDSAGKFGGAYNFFLDTTPGEGGYINLGNPDSLNFGANADKSFSISAWIYPTGWGQIGGAEEYGKIVHKGTNTFGNGGYSFYVYPLGFKLHNNGGGSYKCDNSLALNKWQQISVVYDDNLDSNKITTTFYVNGVKSACTGNPYTGQSNPGADANAPVYIGNIGAGDVQYVLNRDFQGKIDEVLIFNRSLKSEEISSIYNATKSQYVSSFNGLSNGVHKFIGHAVDLEGIKVDTALRSVTINPPTELEVNFIEPTPKDLHVQTINRIPVRLGSSDAVGGHYSFVDFDNSLVGWWRLNMNNLNQIDESSYWNYGVVSGATWTASGKYNGAFDFDGLAANDDRINLGIRQSLNFGANADKSYTIATWIYPRTAGEGDAGRIVDRSLSGQNGGEGYTFYILTSGVIRVNHKGGAISSTGTVSFNQWNYVVAVYNYTSNSVNFYINGNSAGSGGIINPGSDINNPVLIGNRNGFDRSFNGVIDEVLIFNRTLSPDEVEALYDASKADFQYDNEFKGLAEGEHKFIGHAVDLSGARVDTELRSVSVDITSPIVRFSTPPTPINGSVIGVNQFSVGLYSEDNSVQGGGGHYSLLDFDRSLVGWWRLNSNNVNQIDESSYGNDGTVSATGATPLPPTFDSAGKFGGAYSFSLDPDPGEGGYIDLGNPLDQKLIFSTSSFSVSVWINPATTGTYDIVSKRGTGAPGDNRGWGVRMNENTNRLAFELDDGTGNSKAGDEFIGGSISLGAWNHVVVAFDRGSGVAKGYINGESAGDGISISLIGDITGTQNVNIGRAPTNALYFNGKIDEVIIVERNLSVSEIKSLYDSRVNKYSNNFAGLIDGKHNFTGYAVDTDGAIDDTPNGVLDTEWRVVSVDTTNPVISFGALSTADGGIVNGNDFLVDVDVSDYNFGTVEYKLYDSSFNFLNSFITDYHYGFDLDKYNLITNNLDLTTINAPSINPARLDISGVTYNPATNTLYLVDNADQVIIEIDKDYNVRREISLTGFGGIDMEGIAYIESDSITGKHKIAFVEESRNTDNHAILYVAEIDNTATSLDILQTNSYDLGNMGGGDGIEGVSYAGKDSSGNYIFYVVRQTPKEVRKVVVVPGTTTIVSNTQLFDSTVYLSDVSWLRDLYYDNNTNSLFILGVGVSDAVPRKVINVKLDGTRIYAIDNINVGSPIKPEGIVFDLNGENMYVVGEPHHLSRWQRQKDKFSSSYWFMGLGVGTYYYDAVAVDAIGNIGGATSKRRITLTGSGLNLPEIAYNSTTPFGGSFVNVNKIPVGLFSHDLDGQHYSLLDFDNSLVGWWRLNVNNPSQVDESSYGHIGTVSGATFASAGKFGGAYIFDGIGDYIDLGSNIGLSVSGGTIGAWFKSTGTFNAQYIFSHRKDGFDNNDRIYLRIGTGVQDNDFECGFADAISFTTDDNDVAGDNKWHYGLITWDSTTASCYLDGRFIGSYTPIVPLPYADETVYIGDLVTSIDDAFKWIGTIDEVLIFNRKLSEGEIKVLNASYSERYKINGLGSNLKGWWKFDDNPDDGVDDSSGSGNHGEKSGDLVLDSNAHEGSSYSFDGNGDYAEIKDNPSIRLSSGTVSAWINTNTFNGGRIVSKGFSINGAYLLSLTSGVDNDEIQVGFQGFNSVNGRKTQTNIIPSGMWTHVVFTFSNTELKVYVNGIDQGSLVDSGVIDWNFDEELRIGEGFVDYNGRIDDVMIFDKVLSAGEVANLYNSQTSQYANTFNGLSEAGHSFTGYAVDLGGNKVTTEQRTVTVDITNPLISYGAGTLADNIFVGRTDIPVDVDVTESNFENMSHVLYQGKLDFDNLGGYWDFERDSLIQKDLSANNYDGTLVNKGGINLLNNPDFNLIERNYNPGWDVNLNGKIMPVQGANDWSSGYNDSVVSPSLGYHAHIEESCDKDGSPCLEFIDMNGGIAGVGAHRWLGMKQSLGIANYENNEFATGLKLTVSMDVKGNVIDKMIAFGLNYKNNIGGTSWATPDNCVSGNCVIDINFGVYKTSNNWQRISHTFTLPNDIDLSGEVVLQIIGSYDTIIEGNLWVDNVQVEKGDIAHNFLKGPIVEGEIFEGALGMGGSGDYFVTNPGLTPKLDIGIGDFSVSFLFKPNVFSGGVEHLIRKGALSTEEGWRIVHDKSANDIKVYVNDNLGANTFSGNPFFASISPLINTNNWYHVVLVLNRSVNGGAFFYINGALSSASAISSWSSEDIQSADSFYIGGNGNVNINTDGMIDEVMVFNKALSFDDVQDLYFPNRKIMGKEVINQISDKTWNAGIVDGFYQYYADVLDKAGNIRTSELRRITLDNANPNVNFIIPNTTYVFDEAESKIDSGGVVTNDEATEEMSANGGAIADVGGAAIYKFMSLNMDDVHLMFRGKYIGTFGVANVKVDQDGVFPGGEISCNYIGPIGATFGWYDCGAIDMIGWSNVYVKFTDGAGDWVIDTFVQTHSDMFPSNAVGADFTYQSYYPLGYGTIDVNLSSDDMVQHYSFVDFDRSLVGWWKLDVDNPSQVDDSSYGNAGTVSGATFDSIGKFGGAYSFGGTGTDDRIDFGSPASLNLGRMIGFIDRSYTMSAWIYPFTDGEGGFGRIVDKSDAFTNGFGGYSFYIQNSGTRLGVYHHTVAALSDIVPSLLNKWSYVAVVYTHNIPTNDGTVSFYVNGNLVGSPVISAGPANDITNSRPFLIGNRNGLDRTFDGKIDEVLIFNRTLSDAEIKMLYDATENRYFETFSGLGNGHYGLKGYAVDLVGHKNETNRTVTINSDYPYIVPFDLGNQNINPGQTKVLSFEVTAHDGNGWGNLGTMEVSLVRGSINRVGSCVNNGMGGNALEAIYTCSINGINYYDNAGEWNVRLRVKDAEEHMSNYFSDAFLLMEEAYINNLPSLDFGTLTFESVNVWTSAFLLRNWGNVPFSDISVEANDLSRDGTGSDKIYADLNRFYSDIVLGAGACTGVNIIKGSSLLITGASLPVDDGTGNLGKEELYFCLSSIQTGLPGGNYMATGLNMWRITGTSSPIETCGDNVIDSLREEVCDCGVDLLCGTADDNVGAETCVSQGGTSGTLMCGEGCKEFDTTGCV